MATPSSSPNDPVHRSELRQAARGIRAWVLLRHRWFRRLARWQRWVVRVGIVLPLFLFTILLVLTRSPVTRSLVVPRLGAALNLDIEADKVYIGWTGRLVMEGVRCRIPGLQGGAGQVFQAERLRAAIDWPASITGHPTVREIEFIQPVVRLSQSVTDGTLNIEAF